MYKVRDSSTSRSYTSDKPTMRGAKLDVARRQNIPFSWLVAFEVVPTEPSVYLVPVDPANETNCEACQ